MAQLTAADIFAMMDGPLAPWRILGPGAKQLPFEPDAVFENRSMQPFQKLAGGIVPTVAETAGSIVRSTPAGRLGAMPFLSDDAPTGGAGGPSNLTSVDGVANWLSQRGIPTHIAKGAAAGAFAESRLDPNAFNSAGGGQGAFGIGQWRGDRLKGLRARYGDKPTMEQQLEYLAYELKGGDRGGKSVLEAKTEEEALQRYIVDFMRPAAGAETTGDLKRGLQALGKDMQAVLSNPYDPSMDQAALQSLQQGAQAALQPTEVFFDKGPAPELAKPTDVPFTDFSESDAALEAMRPLEMEEKEKIRRERTGFFQGMAEAAMRSPGGEGIGTLLMRIGAGALGGRMAAKGDIEKELDEYEDKLAKFNAAKFTNNWQKAQIHRGELEQQAARLDEYNRANYRQAYEAWKANGDVQIAGNNVVRTTLDPKTGKGVTEILPVRSAVLSAYYGDVAQVQSQIGGRQMQGNASGPVGISNQIVARAAIDAFTSKGGEGGDQGAAAAAAAPAMYANHIVKTGRLAEVIGPEESDRWMKTLSEQLVKEGKTPGSKEFTEALDLRIMDQLTQGGASDPSFMEKLMAAGSTLGAHRAAEAIEGTKTTTSTNAKGQTSTRTTAPANPFVDEEALNDPNNPWGNQALGSYGYQRR